jgi:mono/diheme cytochrome c family protein
MPHFRFTLEQRKNLVAYLLRGDNFGGMDVQIAPDDQPNHSRPSADLIRRGRDVIERSRCTVCHDIPGVDDLLPSSLDWPEPRNDFELLVRDARCLTCHVINGEGGTFAPELTTVGSRLKRKWMEKFLAAPDVIRPLLKQMPKLNVTEAEARTVADYAKRNLTDPRIDPSFLAGYRPAPEGIQLGKQIYDAKGCNACHQIGLTGGAVGPPLTHVADRLEPGYIFQYLKNPQRFKPDVVEPNYGFTNTEAMRLTKYLLSLSAEQKGDE